MVLADADPEGGAGAGRVGAGPGPGPGAADIEVNFVCEFVRCGVCLCASPGITLEYGAGFVPIRKVARAAAGDMGGIGEPFVRVGQIILTHVF